METRIIFDIDGTLLHGTFTEERNYFKSVLSKDDYEKFEKIYFKSLLKYETLFKKYEVSKLSEFLSNESKINITDDIIKGWIDVNCNMKDNISENLVETLEYLKRRQKSLAILTNWFLESQKARLKNAGILEYFDDITAGDMVLKPNKESYILAASRYPIEQCVLIGDDLQKDVYGPQQIGMKSIYYNPNDNYNFDKNKVLSIKNMKELKEMF